MKPIILVAGLARCGTSLTMQMLHGGGIHCAGRWPGFEPDEINPKNGTIDAKWLRERAGHALKLLDPFRIGLPTDMPRMVIWLDRDPRQQALSQSKFVHMMTGLPMANRAHLRRIENALLEQREQSLAELAGWPRLILRFEDLIALNGKCIADIAEFLEPQFGSLNRSKMALSLVPRGPNCQTRLDIELMLVKMAEAAA